MKIVVVSPQWTEEPLFDLGFYEVFHEGLGKDIFSHVTALGSLAQPLLSLRQHLPKTPESADDLFLLANQTVRAAHVLVGQFLAPGARPGCKWVRQPGLTFRTVNDRHFAAWLRDASIDLVVLVGMSENPKVNMLTSAPHIVQIAMERNPKKTAQRGQGDCGHLVVRTLVESGMSSQEVVRMELGDLSQLDSQMIGEFAVSYFTGYVAKLRQLAGEKEPRSRTPGMDANQATDELATRHNG